MEQPSEKDGLLDGRGKAGADIPSVVGQGPRPASHLPSFICPPSPSSRGCWGSLEGDYPGGGERRIKFMEFICGKNARMWWLLEGEVFIVSPMKEMVTYRER